MSDKRPLQSTRISRRSFGAGLAGASLLAASPRFALAADAPDLVLILMADLHSGYAYTAALVKAVQDIVAANQNSKVMIVINGDVFEAGNVLGQRNGGKIDLAMLQAFVKLAPTIVNIGNHDGDIFDPATFVADVDALGATLLTNISDPRTSRTYGPSTLQFDVKGHIVKVTAVGTPALGTYRNGAAWYSVPQPGPYAADNFSNLFAGADFHLALVHTGFIGDIAVLPSIQTPFVLHGGHDHLRFTQPIGTKGLHIQSGYWSNGLAVVGVSFAAGGVGIDPRQIQLTRTSPPDQTFGALIAAEKATLLTDADRKVLGHLPAELQLDDAVLFAAEAVRKAAGADIGMLSHTTFGDGLPAGPVTPFDLAGFVRFDGGFSMATIEGAVLADKVLPIVNQFGDFPYAKRTGDFLYSTVTSIDRTKSYKVVVNGFAAMNAGNRQEYFGTAELVFTPVPDLMLKAIVAGALPA